MEARNIKTLAALGVRLRQAGYPRTSQSLISQWMSGSSRPASIPRLYFYLDKALALTEGEKASLASALGLAKFPSPPQPSKEGRLVWSSSTLAHHGRLL
jgi:hypothetical protein